jgi:di/tricarboxylate transporter
VVRALASEVKLEAGDVVILMATAPELLTLNEDEDMRLGIRAPYRSEEVTTLEAFVAPQAESGYRLPELNLGSRFGATVLGVSRQNHRPGLDLRNVRLRPADRVLLEGPKDRLANLAEETSLMAATEPSARSFRRRRAPIAVGTLLAIVTLAAFDVMPIGALALLGVAFILVMRCIDADEAWASVDGSILILIISMLAVGTALQNTGAIEMLVDAAAPLFAVMPPWLIIFALYGLTSLLTELVTNNAIAVIVTPIAIGLAQSAGIDPRILVMTVMLATSASFATPVGYQTNTLVYGAANYRFTDFLKIGLPMNLMVGLATSAALSLML